jgi:hypothetical protein
MKLTHLSPVQYWFIKTENIKYTQKGVGMIPWRWNMLIKCELNCLTWLKMCTSKWNNDMWLKFLGQMQNVWLHQEIGAKGKRTQK